MTTITSNYSFYNKDRIGSDLEDETQRNLSNIRHSSYMLDNFWEGSSTNHINFATQMQSVNFRGTGGGAGIPSKVIDYDSMSSPVAGR